MGYHYSVIYIIGKYTDRDDIFRRQINYVPVELSPHLFAVIFGVTSRSNGKLSPLFSFGLVRAKTMRENPSRTGPTLFGDKISGIFSVRYVFVLKCI